MQDLSALKLFFNPKSVAIVGASSDPKKPGNTALKNMISMGYKGRIFPINPRESEILGLPCYKSITDVPEPIELCVLLVAAEHTVSVARELAEHKERFNDVGAVVCMSAGFSELNTPEASGREKELVRILKKAAIRLIGPNCVGVMDTVSGLNTNFDIGSYPIGGVSVLTQSGAFGNSFLFASGTTGRVGLNKFVSIGNMADVQMSELLLFLRDDPSTRVVGVYLEGLSDPRAFFEAARRVAEVKPVVVLKSGRSEMGSTAALSHTGAIAGADAIYDGAFRQYRITRARSVSEFYETLRAFSKQPVPPGNRYAVLTHMGGPGTMCIDEISGLPAITMSQLSDETLAKLKAILSPSANINHPPGYVDTTAAHWESLHNQVLTLLFQDKGVDGVIQILAPSAFLDQKLLASEIAKAWEAQPGAKKPLLNVVTFGEFANDLRQGLESSSLPTFDFPDTVARIAANLSGYAAMRSAAAPLAARPGAAAQGPAKRLIASAAEEGRLSLLEPEAYGVCQQYGIRVPAFRVAESPEAALEAAKSLGYPIVLKVVSAKILHKSDIGGVMLGIRSDAELNDAYAKLLQNVAKAAPDVRKPGVLVQKMMTYQGTELVLGALRDRLFGPVVMFGLGGIYVEVFKRVGFRLAPLEVEEAKSLIRETLPAALIKGARGKSGMNVDGIAATLVSLGRLMEEHSHIEQVDLNPCLADEAGCLAVDARIILKR